MSSTKRSPSGMLNAYLSPTDNFTDRLAQQQGRDLRSSKTPKKADADTKGQKTKEKKNDAAARKLVKEMDAMTNPGLLRRARDDQRGLADGSRYYAYL
ncbi:hypothetical protein LTR99_010256 [Exophiala xenobiotica]|uniref:Uncharacterized protein n=1 Tax=Vermiconidia calcicola TaxID=1690605 RepID=A0AAV9Q4S2_9PEZI|nr:hypothetical protein LTR92_007161 [Exophiala xenobiotica]KAK5533975.1 hypothetical protein LTR25_006955 [Vermiconidia calcicola]KAK5534891.1 hypothetical protein LTR23_008566 [Chaetothyriales sp. CCFEE 6169]KAK5272132.1 hypothetical protein LTR96_001762 [Exophiala xenobiotica]KAK5292508.1 hypothetical protein LTR99_010256 [Exophiala xenobiotica]